MVNIVSVFWITVLLFAVIGWMRGWAKELLVSFSVILSLALNHVIYKYIPIAHDLSETDPSLFWVRLIILLVLVYFGYQTVVSIPHLAAKSRTEKLQDTLFGAFLGGLNGYLIAGTIIFYVVTAQAWFNLANNCSKLPDHNYPFQNIIQIPTDPKLLDTVCHMMFYMPPQLLGEPGVYFAIILAFVFVLVVYI